MDKPKNKIIQMGNSRAVNKGRVQNFHLTVSHPNEIQRIRQTLGSICFWVNDISGHEPVKSWANKTPIEKPISRLQYRQCWTVQYILPKMPLHTQSDFSNRMGTFWNQRWESNFFQLKSCSHSPNMEWQFKGIIAQIGGKISNKTYNSLWTYETWNRHAFHKND